MRTKTFDVFVISPFSDDDPEVVSERTYDAERYLAQLTMNGVVAYSTIANMAHLAARFELPVTYSFWKEHCERMIDGSTEVHVLCLKGWETSVGVTDEIKIARELNKKISYVNI